MDQILIPAMIKGQWAGKRLDIPEDGVWFLARRTFTLNNVAPDAHFWITTGGAYQLIVNSTLVGAGPRPHHLKDVCYVDQYDLSKYLNDGENVIAILCRAGHADSPRHAGFWCQLEVDSRPVLWSDQHWDMLDAEWGILSPQKIGAQNSVSVTVDREFLPMEWFRADAVLGKRWSRPDWLHTITMPGGQIAFHPLLPPEISEDPIAGNFCGSGRFEAQGAATGFHFHDIYRGRGVYAGACFRFEEEARELETFFSSDVPFRLYCNNVLVLEGRSADRVALTLHLHAGWNRFLIYQEVWKCSAGVLMQFPDEKYTEFGSFLLDTLEGAQAGWNLVGPLRLPLSRCSAGLRLEGLPVQQFRKRPSDTYLNAAWVGGARCSSDKGNAVKPGACGVGEYRLYRFDRLRYGLFTVALDAPSGAIVDLVTGTYLNSERLPVLEKDRRCVYTLRTCEGENRLISGVPAEGFYVMVIVRRSEGPVTIKAVNFHEMSRLENSETSFKCSDPALNAIWDAGLQSIRRAAASVEPVWSDECGAKLVDQCIQAFNIISIFNDYQASRGRLQVLLTSQLESGEIPICTHSRNMPQQLDQLFAFPLWVLYHHRSGNDPEMLRFGAHALDRLIDFMDGLVDESVGVIRVPGNGIEIRDLFTQELEPEGCIPVLFNACYGRTLLSCGEIFRQLGNKDRADHCFRSAVLLADHLRAVAADPESGLLVRRVLADGSYVQAEDLQANFMALLAGIHQPQEFQNIFYRYFNFHEPFAKYPGESNSGYFNFFFLEMLFALNQSDWALRYLKDFYFRALEPESGSWRSSPGNGEVVDGKLQDGRYAVPNAFIMREAAGVRAAEAGYGAIFFHPPLKTLSYAEIQLPTVHGQIHILWRSEPDGTLNVTIESSYPLRVLPELSDEQLEKTEFTLSDNVTLLEIAAVQKS